MLSALIIEHIPRGSLYDRLIKQPPFRKDQMDMEIRLFLVMVEGCHTGNTILFPELLHEKIQQFIRLDVDKFLWKCYHKLPRFDTLPVYAILLKFCLTAPGEFSPK